ncbi:MFS transporter [Sphingopyxis sp. H038]|uniref:MFS transporter n=1 Tax=unclassified Sphingopyxis TaxID=2614943 RepID=UPI0007316E4B|nr:MULTISPECIES: MFS transporter [unclassified Sphingopyxis]KTE00249.1 MFS transporter [Sphingopyxis sp. H012]KTE06417.1 MFS transporter [Sphingopyxis sp. H053]KTE07237.1 MFS transporter [Sphingopyxis sp. H093]KTE28888.1 MFS transporter [Sphingopyxis sp. H080]KTE31663.1 MFS transporter [Sphingopyxis sp. H038]
MKINFPLLALATGAFGIGITEFAPMGLLPDMAEGLGVSIPAAGLLVSAYALGVLIGAPLMTLTTAKMNRRTLLIGLMAIFTLGNFLSAIAGDYTTLMVARVITSLNHGAFFGVGSVVAASLVAPEKRASAVAAMFMGLTLANVIGVPLAPWVGEAFGWRTAFGAIAIWGLFTMAALRFALPDIPRAEGGNMLAELGVLKRREVLVALALTAIGSAAMFTVFTYIAPILKEATGAGTLFVTAMLVIYGLGLTAGNWLGGIFADRSIDRTLIVSLTGLAAMLILFAVTMYSPIAAGVTIFLWGVATFAIVPPLQMRVMEAASDAPNLASAVNIGAFNLGNAIGAAVGGGVIGLGLGFPAVSIAGAVMAVAGLAIVLASRQRAAPVLAQA